jgi:hypothetical protein
MMPSTSQVTNPNASQAISLSVSPPASTLPSVPMKKRAYVKELSDTNEEFDNESEDEREDAQMNANPKCESDYVFCIAIIVCNNIIS